MIKTIKKDSNTYPIVFFMASSTDHVSAVTGITPTVTLSKNGAAFGACAGAVSEIANGFYKLAGNATDSDTLGPLILHAKGTGADNTDVLLSVVNHNPYEVAEPGDAMTLTAAYDKAKDDVLTPLAVVDTVVDAIKATIDTNLDMAISDIEVNPSIAVSVTEALSLSSGEMALSVYYTLEQAITSTLTDDLSAATKLWFAIKDEDETDANSLIFVEETAGLTIVDKTAYATAAHGTIAVTGSSGDWTVTVTIDEAATSLLSAYDNQYYEASLKAIVDGNAIHVWDGRCKITNGIIRSVS